MLQLAPYFHNPHPHLPTASVVFQQSQKPTMPKRNSNSLSLLFAFLLMNSLGKQAVSTCSISQRVEIALLISLCMLLRQTVSTAYNFSLLLFYKMGEYCTILF